MSLSSPINCQSLPIFHYSCVAPSVPHSTLTRVKQAKREKKKKAGHQEVSQQSMREKFMLLPVPVLGQVPAVRKNNCREGLWALGRDTHCFFAGGATSDHGSGHIWPQHPMQRFGGFGGHADEGFPMNVPISLCSTHTAFTLKGKGTVLSQNPTCQTHTPKCEGSRAYQQKSEDYWK